MVANLVEFMTLTSENVSCFARIEFSRIEFSAILYILLNYVVYYQPTLGIDLQLSLAHSHQKGRVSGSGQPSNDGARYLSVFKNSKHIQQTGLQIRHILKC